jgi:hypothetical protein
LQHATPTSRTIESHFSRRCSGGLETGVVPAGVMQRPHSSAEKRSRTRPSRSHSPSTVRSLALRSSRTRSRLSRPT